MKLSMERFMRFLVSGVCLLGIVVAVGSVSVLSGCDDGKSQMKMIEQTDDPAVIAKGSMDYYKSAHLKGGAPKKK
jgi:hypothetical protein